MSDTVLRGLMESSDRDLAVSVMTELCVRAAFEALFRAQATGAVTTICAACPRPCEGDSV